MHQTPSESELPTGDTSNRQSFTRTYNWKDQSLDLSRLVNLAMQSSAPSAENKREVGSSFQALTVIGEKSELINVSPCMECFENPFSACFD